MKTILIGLGNPILGDDGVGWRVVDEIKKSVVFQTESVEIDCISTGGLALMERLVGYHRAILVDALQTGQHPPGTVIQLRLEDLSDHIAGHMASAHDANLKTALQLGREMGVQLPDHIVIVGIEAQRVYDFSDSLSPLIEAAVPQAVKIVSCLMHTFSKGEQA